MYEDRAPKPLAAAGKRAQLLAQSAHDLAVPRLGDSPQHLEKCIFGICSK